MSAPTRFHDVTLGRLHCFELRSDVQSELNGLCEEGCKGYLLFVGAQRLPLFLRGKLCYIVQQRARAGRFFQVSSFGTR